jgi:hypothetical protein
MHKHDRYWMHRSDGQGGIESKLFEHGERHKEGEGWAERPDLVVRPKPEAKPKKTDRATTSAPPDIANSAI